MTFTEPTVLKLIGGCNFRDLGGYENADGLLVRRGVLYRSGVLSYLTPSDHNGVARAGLRTIVDLRRTDEIAAEPTDWQKPVRILSWRESESIADQQRDAPWERAATEAEAREWMTRSYEGMHEWLAEPLRGIFRAILEEEIPLLFHCAAGKDRTGFCAAIVLRLIGVGEDTVLRDYAFTDQAVDLAAFTRAHRAAGLGLTDEEHPIDRMDPAVRTALISADPVYLKTALDVVERRYGSVENYVRTALGLTDDEIAVVRFQLLDD